MKKYILGSIAAIALLAPSAHASTPCHQFTQNLTVGSYGEDVRNLQIALNADQDTRVALIGPGSSGNESMYFGPATRAAVAKFQQKHLSLNTGFVGALTRAKLNASCVPNNGDVTVIPYTTILSPKGGEVWKIGSTQEIRWSIGVPLGYTSKFGTYKVDVSVVKHEPSCATKPCPLQPAVAPYLIKKNIGALDGGIWKVGETLDLNRSVPAGIYVVEVCLAGTQQGCGRSATPFTIQ